MFTLGLIINPYAGSGGPLGLKGSDAIAGQGAADAHSRAHARALRCLQILATTALDIEVLGYHGVMAENCATEAGLAFSAIGHSAERDRSAGEDTRNAAKALKTHGVDLILFVGGDGTARDIYQAVGDNYPVLGLPAGVKMHSGVYAVSPESAAEIVVSLIRGALVEIAPREVRDIDEAGLGQGQVRSAHYGELLVPAIGGFLQNVKIGGRESEELVLADIADYLQEEFDDQTLYLLGPGSTTAFLADAWGLEKTLLGFDAMLAGQWRGRDLSAAQITALLDSHPGPVKVVITLIAGQGHILGRGNQQLTPELIRRIGRENFIIVASKRKLTELNGRPLLVDSNDAALDQAWRGYVPVITGYRDAVMYRVGLADG